jgi:peptidoglycan/xylan/chitin deacetylase (PgdA/CDA1 family)
MTIRLLRGTGTAVLLTLAACQSVHTQTEPEVISATPETTPLTLSLNPTLSPSPPPTLSSPSPSPSPSPTPTPKPERDAYNSVETSRRVVAMTFDDGPSPKLTPKLLDLLKERGIKATFYVVGTNATKYPEILQRMIAEGHEIGNHTWNHPTLTRLGSAAVASQIERTNAAIEKATGITPATMRPPYGATNAKLNRRYNDEYGLKVIMWSVDPLDWKYRNADRVQREIVAGATPGGIILAHDIHASTVAAMPGTLDALKAKGYEFATVSDLLKLDGQ